jgi:hypothetical protein
MVWDSAMIPCVNRETGEPVFAAVEAFTDPTLALQGWGTHYSRVELGSADLSTSLCFGRDDKEQLKSG